MSLTLMKLAMMRIHRQANSLKTQNRSHGMSLSGTCQFTTKTINMNKQLTRLLMSAQYSVNTGWRLITVPKS